MALRFCHRCACEVEDVGGFCLLGHPLRLEPPIPSLSHIRDEFDRALEEARAEERAPRVEADGADLERPSRWGLPAFAAARVAARRAETRPAAVPPPPPHRTVWESLGEEPAGDVADPIAAFAPPPRMDWGPERARRVPLALRRREGPAPA